MTLTQPPAHLPPPSEARGMRLRMSYDDYLAWADESVIAEWVEGEVIVTMPAKDRHQRIVVLLSGLMSFFAGLRDLGVVRIAPFEVRVLPGRSSREPDLLFVSRE